MTRAELEQGWELARKESRGLRLMLDTCQSASVSREREIERLREERASDKPLNMAMEMATHNRKRAEVLEAELGRVNQEWQMVAIALGDARERARALEERIASLIAELAHYSPTGAGGNPKAFICCEGVGKHNVGCSMETKGEQG